MSELRVWRCDRCGFEMIERHCKVQCPNCGARWDCSDVTIWIGDVQPAYRARPWREDDHGALARQWPAMPSASELRDEASGAWVLLQGDALRGYAALFPVPGLPHMHHLQGAVQKEACESGAGHLLERILQDVNSREVQQITYAVDSLQSSAARLLQGRGFRPEHEEWQMQADLPPQQPRWTLPEGYAVRTLPYPHTLDHFLRLYQASFAATPWYQPYSRAEAAAELDGARDVLFLCHGDTPVGFAWLRHGDKGEVEPIGMAPTYQGQGLGRALLLEALWRLSESGSREVTVGVWRKNETAINLYRSLGLQRVARRCYLVYDVS